MKSKLNWSVALLALVVLVGAASAYAGDPTCQGKKSETAAAQQDPAKGSCPQSAEKACSGCSDKPCDKSGEKPCECKGAATASSTCGDKPSGQSCGGSCGDKAGGCKGTQLTADKPAGQGCGGSCAGSCGGGCPKEAAGGCPMAKKVQTVLTSMPAMKYRVGSEVTGCPKSAAAIAEKTGKPIEYVVGDAVTTDKGEALVKLATMLEAEAEKLQAIQMVVGDTTYDCPNEAQTAAQKSNSTIVYRVGGVDFQKQEDAKKAIAAIKGKLASVKMTYKVDDQTYDCPKTAKSKCDGNGKHVTYVVGSEETPCEQTARLNLAQAKIRTIVETASELASS